jgi:hypothetical protein
LQGTYSLWPGQDKVLRRIGTIFEENIPDESSLPLRLPGDPATTAPTPIRSAVGDMDVSPVQHHDADRADSPSSSPRLPDATGSPSHSLECVAPRRMGPAAPSAALRQAAAAAAAEMADQGLLQSILERAPPTLVGPAPPAALADAEGTTLDARNQEVERVMSVLRKFDRAGKHLLHFLDSRNRMRGRRPYGLGSTLQMPLVAVRFTLGTWICIL